MLSGLVDATLQYFLSSVFFTELRAVGRGVLKTHKNNRYTQGFSRSSTVTVYKVTDIINTNKRVVKTNPG